MKGDRERCLRAGMQDYIAKPVSKKMLRSILAKWLPLHKQIHLSDPSMVQDDAVLREASCASAADFMIDQGTLDETRNMLAGRFDEMVSYYLQDSAGYLAQMDAAFDAGDVKQIAAQAHTLKSSSRGLGLTSVADIAKSLENDVKAGQSIDQLTKQQASLTSAFEHAKKHLMALGKQEAA